MQVEPETHQPKIRPLAGPESALGPRRSDAPTVLATALWSLEGPGGQRYSGENPHSIITGLNT